MSAATREAECLRTDPDLRRSSIQSSDLGLPGWHALARDGHLRVSCGPAADWPGMARQRKSMAHRRGLQRDCTGERLLPLSLLWAPRGRDARLVRALPRLLPGGRRGPVPLADHGRRSGRGLPDRGPAQLPGLRTDAKALQALVTTATPPALGGGLTPSDETRHPEPVPEGASTSSSAPRTTRSPGGARWPEARQHLGEGVSARGTKRHPDQPAHVPVDYSPDSPLPMFSDEVSP